ncbi:putative reverse transcriptase domain-containing protein, partial [Tanacetum coccineum]
TNPTLHPRSDDPYVMVRDAVADPARDDDDDLAALRDPQPSQPRRCPRNLQIMPPKKMTQAAIEKLITDRVVATIAEDHATRGNAGGAGRSRGNARGQGEAPPVRECSFNGFMKCNPTTFYGNKGAMELCRWFEKTESVFGTSKCDKRNKVKFVAATLKDRALTWWNSQVATLGLEVANGKPLAEMKTMIKEEFCLAEEIQRMEIQLWKLRVKDSNIAAYTQRFNELVLLCTEVVPSEKKKIETYIRGLPENVKGERTSSKPTTLNEAVQMTHTLMEQKLQSKAERVAEGNKRRWENNQSGNNNNWNNNNNNRGNYRDNTRHHQYDNRRQGNARAMTKAQNEVADQTGTTPNCANAQPVVKCHCYECGERGHTRNRCPKRINQQGGNATGRAYAMRDVEQNPGPNVVTGTFLLNNHYAR